MNSPGAYQKAPIGTKNRLVIVRCTPGGGLVSIGTEMVSNVARLGFSPFLGEGIFAEIGINWKHRVPIGAVAYYRCPTMI